jgi:tetratricopeptide (TPR) repeat protein
MAHRVFRLSISPEDLPEVRRVIDFDGRHSLQDVHQQIQAAYGMSGDPLYGFFMSGRVWDAGSAYLDRRAEGRRADKALLFRLELAAGKTFAYLCDFNDERRFTLTVETIRDVEQALASPTLIESLGNAPVTVPRVEAPAPEQDPPELAELVKLAEDFLDLDDEVEDFANELASLRARLEPWSNEGAALQSVSAFRAAAGDGKKAENIAEAAPQLRETAAAALALVQAFEGRVQSFLKLDEWLLARALGPRLLDLPMTLAFAGQAELGLSLAREMVFIDPELLQGDIAVILALAGRRDEALAQIESNLEGARDAALVEAKAGDTYRALGDAPAAEAYYRRSLAESKTSSDRLHALLRLVTCLTDTGRDAEASALLLEARKERGVPVTPAAAVGRNDACPCGSGKKYKKCHGAGG